MDDIACPRCKTTKYRNPSLKLLVNVCGHGLCDNCVELLFVKGSGKCPQCEVPLRRNNFRLQIFEDASVEKELDIRRKILKDFNKKEADFASLREYNDYLEEIETIISNLVNNVNVEATKRKIELYKKENKNVKRKNKLSKDEEEIDEYLEQERNETEWRRQQILEEETEKKRAHVVKKEALIDDLMFSDLPANLIIANHGPLIEREKKETKSFKPRSSARGPVKFSSGIKLNQDTTFLPVPKHHENVYVHVKPKLPLYGPDVPTSNELSLKGYLVNICREAIDHRAGGFTSHFACERALQRSFCALFLPSDQASELKSSSPLQN